MWNWLRQLKKTSSEPVEPVLLRGAPAHLRTKSYSAQTGYVYQYVFRGYRLLTDPAAREYVFDVHRDRTEIRAVCVRLSESAIAECSRHAGRDLIDAERYAIAKMTLFAGFDEFETPDHFQRPWVPDSDVMEEHLRTLGRL